MLRKRKMTFQTIVILMIYSTLTLMGYLNLESAVINSKYTRLPLQQIYWIIIGVSLIAATAFFLERITISKLLIPGYIISVGFLFLLLIVGESWGGSRRWFSTPVGGLQPSEFVKPFMIVLYSYIYANTNNTAGVSLLNLLLVLPVAGLIAMEPDLGTSMVFVFMVFLYYVMAEKNKKRLLLVFIVLVLLVLLLYTFGLKPYQKERITAFLDPEKNPDTYYHTQQSITMVASAGLYGKGYQRGLGNLYGYIPADHTDFVLAVYAEEEGFLGMIVFYSLWFFMFSTILSLIRRRTGVKKWLSVGVFSIFFVQFIINVGMVIGLLPVTGLPLPFFTYGGSSTASNSIITGMLLWASLNDERHVEVLIKP